MDKQQLFAKDTTQRLYELLNQQFGDTYTIFNGMPLTPPVKTEMPCIVIDRKNASAVLGPTETDEVNEMTEIWVMLSLADEVGSPDDNRTHTKRKLELFVQGQDPTTKQYRTDTLYYVMRTYLTLQVPDFYIINSNIQTVYDTGILQDGITNVAASTTTMTTWHRVIVPNRQ